MNASCNWVGLLQVSSVHCDCEQTLTVVASVHFAAGRNIGLRIVAEMSCAAHIAHTAAPLSLSLAISVAFTDIPLSSGYVSYIVLTQKLRGFQRDRTSHCCERRCCSLNVWVLQLQTSDLFNSNRSNQILFAQNTSHLNAASGKSSWWAGPTRLKRALTVTL